MPGEIGSGGATRWLSPASLWSLPSTNDAMRLGGDVLAIERPAPARGNVEAND